MNPDLWNFLAADELLASLTLAEAGMGIAVLMICLLAWRRGHSGGAAAGALLISQALRWALLRDVWTPWTSSAGEQAWSAACLGVGASALGWMAASALSPHPAARGTRVTVRCLAWLLALASIAIVALASTALNLPRMNLAQLAAGLALASVALALLFCVMLFCLGPRPARHAGKRPDGFRASVHPRASNSENNTVPLGLAGAAPQIERRLALLEDVLDRQRHKHALLAHEMRSPVATISAAAQSLQVMLEGSDAQIDARLDRIGRSLVRITELTEQLLQEDPSHDKAVAPEQQTVDLAELCRQVAVAMQADVAHPLQVEAPAPALAWCDGPLTAVVLRNLIHNAAKYSPADQPIVIQVGTLTAATERTAWITVLDRGPGIEAEDQVRIFEPHFRRAAHRETKGMGLGLYLVRKICERQAGSLTVDSAPGQGARFTITLPGRRTR